MTYIPLIQSARLANDAVTSAKILDGEVVNADVAAGAAIAVTKLALGGADTVLQSDGVTNSFSSTTGANARVAVNKNSGATVGTRRRLNFIEGSNVTLTITDDGANEEVDITIASAGIGSANIDDLNDVDTTGVVDGALLRYESTGSVWNDTSTLLFSDAGQLQVTTTGASAGLLLGGDAQWYRSAADTLRTPDDVVIDLDLTVTGKTDMNALSTAVASKTANYTVNLATDHTILADSTGGAFTITLPASHAAGDEVVVKDSGGAAATNNITVATADTDQIEGSASDFIIAGNRESFVFKSDGTNWHII